MEGMAFVMGMVVGVVVTLITAGVTNV